MANTNVVIVDIHDPSALQAEAALDSASFPLPLPSRVAWGRHFGASAHKLAIAVDASGQVLAAVGLELTRTHALPGYHILRVHAFGDPYATTVGENLLAEIARYAVAHGKVLRVVVELECRAESGRELLRRALVSLGFRQGRAERIPARTLAIDLARGEDEILTSFKGSTRHKVRKGVRHGLQLAPLIDPAYSARMNALLAETFARTGGYISRMNWEAIMTICRELPHRSRLVGVFLGSGRAPDELLAYAWGTHHGERALYDISASTRNPEVRLPLLYPALWDLIAWAKREGAIWFDMNGITEGTSDSDDPLGNISDFKRGFGGKEIALGEEWIYEPSVLKASVANLASDAARRVSRLFQAFPSRVRQS